MKPTMVSIILLLLSTGASISSEPGQPLRGEDFVLLLPGLTAESVFPAHSCTHDAHGWCWSNDDGPAFDSVGNQYGLRVESLPLSCTPPGEAYKWTVMRLDAAGLVQDVAYIQTRCVQPQGPFDSAELRNVRFDLANGWLYMVMYVYSPGLYNNFYDLVRIKGLPNIAEVVQTFVPSIDALGFRVPKLPEGLAGVEHFDTYWGPLTRPFTFTNAQPLQCGYPALPPNPGDYLSVADTLPTPAVGEGVYYVTASTYQGQRRFGRRYVDGTYSGRDPSALPVCQ